MKTIFIQVASFNEKEIYNTVESAFQNAEHPSRVYFGLYDQRIDDSFSDFSHNPNVIHVKSISNFARGIGIARLSSLMLHADQDYCLQIDGHTLFDKNWDSNLISDFEDLKKITDKPIISYRTKFWERDENDNIIFYTDSGNPHPLIIDSSDNHFYMKTDDSPVSYPVEHYLSSGGFVFAELSFFKEFIPDPSIAFAGEEHILALRACTRGYKIYVTKDPYIWHMSKSLEYRQQKDSWGSHSHYERNSDLNFRSLLSDSSFRVNHILTGQILGYWGAPDIESYNEYIQKLGFDYRTGKSIKE